MPKGYHAGLKQAYDIRDLTAAEAIALLRLPPPDSLPDRCRLAMAVTSLVKGWEAASDRVRIARGKPLPGSLRPSQSKPARQPARRSGLAAQPARQPDQSQVGPTDKPEPPV